MANAATLTKTKLEQIRTGLVSLFYNTLSAYNHRLVLSYEDALSRTIGMPYAEIDRLQNLSYAVDAGLIAKPAQLTVFVLFGGRIEVRFLRAARLEDLPGFECSQYFMRYNVHETLQHTMLESMPDISRLLSAFDVAMNALQSGVITSISGFNSLNPTFGALLLRALAIKNNQAANAAEEKINTRRAKVLSSAMQDVANHIMAYEDQYLSMLAIPLQHSLGVNVPGFRREIGISI